VKLYRRACGIWLCCGEGANVIIKQVSHMIRSLAVAIVCVNNYKLSSVLYCVT